MHFFFFHLAQFNDTSVNMLTDACGPTIAHGNPSRGDRPGDPNGEPGRIGPIYRLTRYFHSSKLNQTGTVSIKILLCTRELRVLTVIL